MTLDNKETIQIKTYQLDPYFAAGKETTACDSIWFREETNRLVRENRQILEGKKADISLFYNHNPESGRTRIGYPLIIYHRYGERFYITGINEGAWAVNCLAEILDHPFRMEDVFFDKFKLIQDDDAFLVGTVPVPKMYRLIAWIPFHHRELKAYKKLNLVEKVAGLNNKLKNHITGEMGKYLGIHFEELEAEITEFPVEYDAPVIYKGFGYIAYDISFKTNVVLPPFLTLGNNKSMGYGRIVPL